MKIGLVVAVHREINEMLKKIGNITEHGSVWGYDVRSFTVGENEIIVVKSNAGEISAASATQLLITHFGVEIIANFGVVGGLVPEMSLCSTAVVEKVVHYDFDTSEIDNCEVGRYMEYPTVYLPCTDWLCEMALKAEPSLKKVTCASGDKFIGDPDKKAELAKTYDAHICEMEAAGIVLTANRCGVPVILIKAVSDSVQGGADEFANMISHAAEVCVNTLLKVIENIK